MADKSMIIYVIYDYVKFHDEVAYFDKRQNIRRDSSFIEIPKNLNLFMNKSHYNQIHKICNNCLIKKRKIIRKVIGSCNN